MSEPTMRRRLKLPLPAALALVLVLAGTAKGTTERTIVLNWQETTPSFGGYPRMTFAVKAVVIGNRTWAVRASFVNRSKQPVRITKPAEYPEFGFALVGPAAACPSGHTCAPDVESARYSKPPFPRTLAPGQSWSGTFGGRGTLPRGKVINVAFGHFVLPRGFEFDWLTFHAFRL